MALLVGIFFLLAVEVSPQSLIVPAFYDVFKPAPFNGSSLTTTGANCQGNNRQRIECSAPSKLIDGDFGPMDSLIGQLGRFFAYNQNDSRLSFTIGNNVSKVVLYFFNSPANAIGLPLIKVFFGIQPVPYFFSDNGDLTQTDSQLRTVTLQLSQEIGNFQLDFFFSSSSSIDWFLVSEVQLYSGSPISPPMEDIIFKDGDYSVVTLGPDNIQSSISLNCTVINSGSFEWQWVHNGVPVTDQVFIEDATRTSILNIDQPSGSNKGNYICTANNSAGSTNQRIINLQIIGVPSYSTSTIFSQSTVIMRPTITYATSTNIMDMTSSNNGSGTTATPPPTFSGTTTSSDSGADTVVIALSVSVGLVVFVIVILISLTILIIKMRQRCLNEPIQAPMYKISYNIAESNRFPRNNDVPVDNNRKNEIPLFTSKSKDEENYLYELPEISDQKANDEDAIYAKPNVNKVIRIREENLQEIAELGVGQFGEVVLAKTVGLSLKDLRLSKTDTDKFASIQVAVKKIKENHDDQAIAALKKEIKLMSRLDHENVVRLLAVSASCCPEQFIVMEYMENGDLNQYLLNHTFTKSHQPPKNHLSPQILLFICIQIANGMSYLASQNYVHRDLAARNILVGKNNIVKVGDFGLSRNLYDSAYYKVSGKAKMPIRWMAKECFYGKFSETTDLWAYGVTVWQVYNMSRDIPYASMTDQEVIDNALKGTSATLLERPENCPEKVYSIIVKLCWSRNRKCFAQVHKELVHLDQKLYQYVDILEW